MDLVVFFSNEFYTFSVFSLEVVSTSGWMYLLLLPLFKTFLALEPSFFLTDFMYMHTCTHTHRHVTIYFYVS